MQSMVSMAHAGDELVGSRGCPGLGAHLECVGGPQGAGRRARACTQQPGASIAGKSSQAAKQRSGSGGGDVSGLPMNRARTYCRGSDGRFRCLEVFLASRLLGIAHVW